MQVRSIGPTTQDPTLLKQQSIAFRTFHVTATITKRQVEPAIVPNRNSKPAVLLRESYRDAKSKKPCKRTLANLSKLPSEQVDAIRRILKGEKLVSVEDAFEIIENGSRHHGHVDAVLSATPLRGQVRGKARPRLLEVVATRGGCRSSARGLSFSTHWVCSRN